MKRVILAAVAAFSMNVAVAEDATVIVGFGARKDSCGDCLKARRDNSFTQGLMVSWAQGFISGMNSGVGLESGPRMVNAPGSSVFEAWLDKHCAADPTKDVFGVMLELYLKLRQDQARPQNSK